MATAKTNPEREVDSRLSLYHLFEPLRLSPGEVHVWRVGLQIEGLALCACWDLLSPEETRVASSHRFVKEMREFVITRAVLRQMLARYTGQSAADLRFAFNPCGKPYFRVLRVPISAYPIVQTSPF